MLGILAVPDCEMQGPFWLARKPELFAIVESLGTVHWLEDADNALTDHFRSLLHGMWLDLVAYLKCPRIRVNPPQILRGASIHPSVEPQA